MSKIRLGILGGGEDSLIGILHRVAANMFDQFEIVGGVFDVQHEKSLEFGKKLQLDPSRYIRTWMIWWRKKLNFLKIKKFRQFQYSRPIFCIFQWRNNYWKMGLTSSVRNL